MHLCSQDIQKAHSVMLRITQQMSNYRKLWKSKKKREKNKFKKKLSSFFFLNMLPLDSHQIIRPVLLKHTLSSNALSTLDEFACPRVAIPAWVYLQVRLRPCAALGSRTLQVHPEIYIKKTPKSRSLKKRIKQ